MRRGTSPAGREKAKKRVFGTFGLCGQTAWTLLGMDTSSPYIDGRPLAVPTAPEVREYMLRGVISDAEVGLDSDVLSIIWAG